MLKSDGSSDDPNSTTIYPEVSDGMQSSSQSGYGAPPQHGAYGPTGQPQHQQPPPTSHTTVIVQQPVQVPGGKYVPRRDWSTGIFGCFEDIPSCLLVWFCQPCHQCYMSDKMGESCCVPACVPGGMIALRTRLRTEQGIQGSICNDCLIHTFCSPCADCQLDREWKYIGDNML